MTRTICCDECEEIEHPGDHDSVEDFERRLVRRGWLLGGPTTLCPACLEARELMGKLEAVK